MEQIIFAVIVVSAIGFVAGLGLAIASKVMAVPVDERAEKIQEILPGANCGSCGFSGCSGYAGALSKGETTNTALCNPGGNEVSKLIAEIMGLNAGEVKPSAAVVLCQGNNRNASKKLDYSGVLSCKMANQLFGGPKDCIYGCIGCMRCVKACESGAVTVTNFCAKVDYDKCIGCGRCAEVCTMKCINLVDLNKIVSRVV